MLDDLFQYNSHVKLEVLNLLRQGMQSGAVRPLNRTVFAMNQAEEAFRYMSTGQHTGKVLIQTRQEEFKPTVSLFPALPKYTTLTLISVTVFTLKGLGIVAIVIKFTLYAEDWEDLVWNWQIGWSYVVAGN